MAGARNGRRGSLAGVACSVVGGVVVLLGAFLALRPLGRLYDTAGDLSARNDADPKAVSGEMLRGAGVGAIGVPLLVAGMVLRARAKRKKV